jgi:hypothetical protein
MKNLLLPSLLAVSLLTGCKKKQPSCDEVVDHMMSMMPPELQSKLKGDRATSLAKCEKLSPESRKCAFDAKSLEELMKCPRDGASTKAAEPTADMPKPSGEVELPAAFQAWDMAGRKAAWQGAWSGDGDAAGWKAAWQIDGDKIDMVDGKGEKHLALKLQSPCSAAFVEHGADGSTSWTIKVYTLQNGQLITGLGDAGQKKGDQAVVCGGGSVFTVDAKGCTEWDENFGKLESKPGDCGFDKDGFRYKANGMENKLLVEGDVIWSEALKMVHATKQPDLAAAKKAQAL